MSADELSKTTSSGSDSSPSTNEVTWVCFNQILNSDPDTNLLFFLYIIDIVVQHTVHIGISCDKSFMLLT